MFEVDFDKFITWCIPAPLRKPIRFAWLQVLCGGVKQLYGEFMTKRAADNYQLSHDSRVFSIEAVLNDQFDTAARRIYIDDGPNRERLYIFTPDEEKPLYLGTQYLYNPADYADTGVDFIVYVPNAVPLSAQGLILMNSLITKYKLASKRYQIYRTA